MSIIESKKIRKLIIIDVQPEFEDSITFNVENLLRKAVYEYTDILVLWCGPSVKLCSENTLKRYYHKLLGSNEELTIRFLKKTKFFDKGFGFCWHFINNAWFEEQDVISIGKYMLENGIDKIQDLTSADVIFLNIPALQFEDLNEYVFFLPNLKNILSEWSGSSIAGGSVGETLDEIEILAKILDIQLQSLHEFIY